MVSDVGSLIDGLISSGIISEDDFTIFASDGIRRYQKVGMLLNTVRSCIAKNSKPKEFLLKFTIVLKNQNNETLKRISTEIRSLFVFICFND